MGVVEDGRFGGLPLCVWGKFIQRFRLGYPVLFHMLDVAVVAGELWDKYLTLQQRRLIADGLGLGLADARKVVMFWAGCHDLGKVSRFQECEPVGWARVSDELRADTGGWPLMRHERASMHAMAQILAEFGYPLSGNASPAVRAAQIIGGHHGWFHQCDVRGSASSAGVQAELGGPLWQEVRLRYAAQVRHLTGGSAVPSQVSVPAAVLISGLVMVADRLASQPHVWVPRAMAPAFGAAEHYAAAGRPASPMADESWAAQIVTDSGLERVDLPPASFTTAHPHLEHPNQLQESVIRQLDPVIADRGTGILVVTDRTGAGKTVTALEAQRIFNHHCDTRGAAILQPSTAIADALYETLVTYVAAHRPERAPVTLVHSHSYLNPAYTDHALARAGQLTLDEYFTPRPGIHGRPEHKVTVPDPWLRGFDRALLAQFTVATLDQALMGVLPSRYSALRMLAMSGRTVIIDEAHSYTPYTLTLMQRLVHWLGALGCPVVVLSATLPAEQSAGLIRSYLSGAGHPPADLAERDFTVPYPGWLFAAAHDASATLMDEKTRQTHIREHRSTASISLTDVTHQPYGDPDRIADTDGRLQRIAREVERVAEHGGSAAIHTQTVAEAQDTYRYLRRAFEAAGMAAGEELVLLHARFPGHQREPLTRRICDVLGPRGRRPRRLIAVTTNLLDMGLDIDLDVQVSDLASLHRLLQRMGRLWRFESLWRDHDPHGLDARRPTWVRKQGPVMTVLNPVEDGRTAVPDGWLTGDTEFWMHRTAALLSASHPYQVRLPEDVPDLVQQLHAPAQHPARVPDALADLYTAHVAAERHATYLGATQAVPPPDRVGSLADLHRRPTTAGQAATRDGDRPRRLLPCHVQPGGRLTLDAHGNVPLPQGPRLKPHEIRRLLQCAVPVPAAWVQQAPDQDAPRPKAWTEHPLLSDLILLAHDPQHPGPVCFGRHQLHMDHELGLVHRILT
ncbi:CRISPR-associated endonuclease Cas3'' [Streptomyces sp. NBC_00887]|nr:CRISPR-associated endonuclease Cas3'' [Streptomyces sp. NBC_00887]